MTTAMTMTNTPTQLRRQSAELTQLVAASVAASKTLRVALAARDEVAATVATEECARLRALLAPYGGTTGATEEAQCLLRRASRLQAATDRDAANAAKRKVHQRKLMAERSAALLAANARFGKEAPGPLAENLGERFGATLLAFGQELRRSKRQEMARVNRQRLEALAMEVGADLSDPDDFAVVQELMAA